MGQTKKKIRPGNLEIHPKELAIVVNYEIEEVLREGDGTEVSLNKKKSNKKVKVKAITPATNIPLLAQEIVEKCKLINASKVGAVEELLWSLQKREAGNGEGDVEGGGSDMNTLRQRNVANSPLAPQWQQYEPANINDLENYIEDLYEEDIGKKAKATGMIAQLIRQTDNFEALLLHETLLSTLARVLRDDGRKSMDLCINVCSIFFSISNFSQFHRLVSENQIGALTMDIIELEIKRTDHRTKEDGMSPAQVAQKAMDARAGLVELADRDKKLLGLMQKQDRLLYICFYMLLNLAEDLTVERKMKKKNIVLCLVKMLDRSNVELLILVVTFLKKLSIYKENKEKMADSNIIARLVKFVPVSHEVLLMAVLRLLHNLSFDVDIRGDMVKNGLIPKVVDLMRDLRFQPVVLGILYHISIEETNKSLFTYTDAIPIIFDMLMQVEDLRSAPELIALAVNLSQNQRNAELFCEGQRFDQLIRRGLDLKDELLFKVVRNLSQHDNIHIKRRFGPYVDQLVALLKAPDAVAELFVEVLGGLANLSIPEFDFLAICERHGLLDFLSSYARPSAVDDDILLEIVMFVGVLCNEGTAPLIVKAGLVDDLVTLMGEKKDDDEFVLQIAFTFHRFLMFPEGMEALMGTTQAVFYLVDLLQDKHKEVRRTANACLDLIMDKDEEWAERIRDLKFEAFNQEWLEIVDASLLSPSDALHKRVRALADEDQDETSDGEVEFDSRVIAGHGYDFENRVLDVEVLGGGQLGDDVGIDGYDDYDEDELLQRYVMRVDM